jgi:hypothetical protein
MNGKIPACSTLSVEGISTTSGHVSGYVGNNTVNHTDNQRFLEGNRINHDPLVIKDQTNKIQAIITGNRCGHVPSEPRFFNRPDHHKARPSVLEKAVERLKDVYRQPKKFFKKLGTFHSNNRQKRSERREAVVSVAQVLLHYLELSTLRVGFHAESLEFIALDLEYIAKKAGISVLRARRALADLIRVGYLKVSRRFDKKENGSFAGFPSIREISIQFFIDLGIDAKQLIFARDWKRKKQEKAKAKATHKKLSGILHAAVALNGNKPVMHSVKKQDAIAVTKAQIEQALALHRLDPTLPPSDYLKALQKRQE